MKDLTCADYMHEKRVYSESEMKNVAEYHDFYLKSDTLLFADIFITF